MNLTGPLKGYESAVSSGDIQYDEAQFNAVRHLQVLFDQLMQPPVEPGWLVGWFKRLLPAGNTPAPITGLYFWGGVGRGKTYLMDTFYSALPFPEKSRMHFHRFMRMVHHQLKELQGQADPLQKVADQFSRQARVLCFDEFFVSDITDAMMLATLLDELFRRGVVLVATSNVEPRHLYENGLQRRKFLPAIELIEKHTRVVNVDGGIDYRLRVLELAEIYHSPLDEAADRGLLSSFIAICPDEESRTGSIFEQSGEAQSSLQQPALTQLERQLEQQTELEIEGRMLKTRRCGDGVAWFDFAALCDGPRSQNDYIELARIFQTILISDVPQFDSKMEDQARRFISLVDEFYDRGVKLILSAAVPIAALYQGDRLEFEFRRTESRLQEMQSHEYLAREHKP
jgi:cell division protein ZapE